MPEHLRRPRHRRRSRSAVIASGTQGPRELIDRILATAHVEHVVPRLQPEVLHRLIQHCGLEACGDLVALATPDQLTAVFDLDLWRAGTPGRDEHLDVDRFGAWIETLVECGASVAAKMIAATDAGLVSGALAQHVRVFDSAAIAPFVSLDGEEVSTSHGMDDSSRCEVGGFVVIARRSECWSAITDLLRTLKDEHPGQFCQIMSGCRRLSNSRPEVDGLDDLMNVGEQVMFDLAVDRERRRATHGFVTPAEARGFLEASRRIDLRHGVTRAANPVARAHFQDMNRQAASAGDSSAGLPASRRSEAPDQIARAVDDVVELVREAGVLRREPRALLERPGDRAPRFSRIRQFLQFVRDADTGVFSMRTGELAFLANVIVAGSSVQARPFSAEEASNGALAVCSLGLENWPLQRSTGGAGHRVPGGDTGAVLPDDFLVVHDLVGVFEVGWTVLYENVCMYAADRLVHVLASFRCGDRTTQEALDSLRATMTKQVRQGTPWRARDALDVMAILDMPAWAALLALTDEFPVLHAAVEATLSGNVGQVGAGAFEFFSDNRQITMVHDFMQSLPRRLR